MTYFRFPHTAVPGQYYDVSEIREGIGIMDSVVAGVLLAVAVILVVSAALGWVSNRLGQPAVIGQILAGIALGPSVLGRLPGHAMTTLFSPSTVNILSVLSQVALVLFMLSIGYETDLHRFRNRSRPLAGVIAGSLLPPALTGALLGWILYTDNRSFAGPHTNLATFVGYLAVCLSITAMPVLASIIKDRGIGATWPAALSMGAGAITDVVGWLGLAFVIANSTGRQPLITVVLFLGYVVIAVLLVRPLLRRWLHRTEPTGRAHQVFAVVALALGSAWISTELGLHAIFGAFLVGLLLPRPAGQRPLLGPIEDAGAVLLPTFFITAGLSVNIAALHTSDLLILLAIVLCASISKGGGSALGARLSGMDWHGSAVVGSLMNTRGLTELVVINLGLTDHIISARAYTILVLMALVVTIATGPLLTLLRADAEIRKDPISDEFIAADSTRQPS